MKILLTEQDIRRMVKKAVHCIMEERIKDVNLDPSNFISGNGITGIYKTKSNHLYDRCDQRNVDEHVVIDSIFMAADELARKYATQKMYNMKNNMEIINKDVIGKNHDTDKYEGCLFIELRFFDREDLTDERNIAQLAGTPFKHIISLTTVGYWTGESDTPIKSDLVSVHLGSDNQVFKDSLQRQNIMLKRRVPNNILSNGGEMDDWYKKRDPKNDKKKKFGYGADYVSENKKKLTNR